ncbi:MAG: L,D-transpeptidase family protein [Oscillospiraceae bacterium]
MSDKQIPEKSNDNSKEEMARTIAKNISAKRRETEPEAIYSEDKAHGRKTLKEEDFIPHEKKRSSKGKIVLLSIAALVLSFALTFYFVGMAKTSGKFLPQTYINGGNVGGMTKEEASDAFRESQNGVIPKEINIKKFDGSQVSIPADKIGYTDNIDKSVSKLFDSQNHYLWFKNYFSGEKFDLSVEYTFDYDILESELKRRIIDTSLDDESKNASIEKNGDDFVIVKEVQGGKIDSTKESRLLNYIKEQVSQGNVDIDISTLDFYEKPQIVASDLKETCDKLNTLKDIKIVYDFDYTKETLSGKTIIDWITFDENSQDVFDVDEDKAMAYVEKLADKYDTYGKDRTFNSTSRGTIIVKQGEGCYGWWIDQQKTCDALIEAIKAAKTASLKPIYYVNPNSKYEYVCDSKWRTAKTDIGNTYMEVDLKEQHFWYYQNGKLKYECDIVSGYPSESRNTPAGVYRLWYKEKGKTLTGSADGQSYSSYVEYWNNISTIGIGLHDASWQNGVFGGTKYKSKTWGSHGCINMPLEAAKFVYEKIPMGTPCIIYK